MNLLEKLGAAVAGAFVLFAAYMILVFMPYATYAESQCLKYGWPTASVTFGLTAYCTNLRDARPLDDYTKNRTY